MWETIKSDTLLSSYHASVKKNKVRLPDGAVIDDFYTVTIPDSAMIAAITSDNRIVLKKEFRYACGEEVIECPAGMFDQTETDPLAVAKRELSEETGYTSKDWRCLGPTWESTSKLTNRVFLFLALNCEKTGTQHLDENEHLELMTVDMKKAVEMVMNGEINSNSAAHLILKAAKIMESEYGSN